MSKFHKDLAYWIILWTILLGVLSFFVGVGVARVFAMDVAIEDTAQTSPIVYLKWVTASELQAPLVSLKKDPELKQNQVADRLHGPELYRFYISQIHEQYYPDVDPYIALAVLEIESNNVPNLTSSAGAVGLMQWIPKWHAWRMAKFHLNDPFDPYTNIIVGMDYLNDLIQSTGSWRKALYGYNYSTDYVNAVLAKADRLMEGGYFG